MEQDKQKRFFTKPSVLLLLALFSCFLWGSAFPSIKIGYDIFNVDTSNTYQIILFAGMRFFISGVLIFLYCFLTRHKMGVTLKDIGYIVILGVLQTFLQYWFFYVGMSNISGTNGSILSSTSTFFSVILAHFFYVEDKLNFRKLSGVIIGFIGIVILNIGGTSGEFTLKGDGFVMLSSLFGAFAGIYTKKLTKNISPFAISAFQLLIGSVALMGIGYTMSGGIYMTYTFKGSILLLYMGFISAAAFTLWSMLLKYNGVGKVSIYKFSVPLFGVFLSFITLGERVQGFNVLFSILLVSIGIILINAYKK